MRVAITGSEGFTGRYLSAALDRYGIDHVAIDVDVTDPAALDAAVRNTEFDRLIHLAATAFAGSNDWRGFYEVNQLGTCNLLDSVARHRAGARCILASSAQVYGPNAAGLINEAHVCIPANHYAISKYGMELAAQLFSGELEILVPRPFNYTGVGQDVRYVIPKIVDHFRRRAREIELGNLWVKRDFGDVRSVAEAYCALAVADDPPSIINIGTGNLHSIEEILDMLGDLTGHRPEISVNPEFVRPNDVPALGADITLARASLPGWTPLPLEQTLEWMLTSPDW